ncbi:acyl esterase [Peribacillus butanolivorans]|uniref:CocE/NonD family hydrolase n=1 Tax=Peribacillus butanolivorans TaxID=421767 RepID=UPI0006A6E410|nr:CocE/NonD family hydrolase [Peribacillus butanolivorans]KON68875.1 acyl esterase [Peribacillus butanolivorans]
MNKFLGRPDLKPTDIDDIKPGLNKIVVRTVHYGDQEMIMEKDVPVKTRSGITLYVNVFRPDKPGKFPVVMSADTYGKDNKSRFGSLGPLWPTLGAIPISDFTAEESPDPGFWVPNDYVLIKVALRGSAKSEGGFRPWSRIESEDYYDVIEWAGVQEWSNGNVGTNGVSYLAVTQWWVSSLNPPHLKAMIPWEGLNDVYRECAFHGGIPDTGFFQFWVEGLFARWPDNKDNEDMREGQKEHPLFDDYWKNRQVKLSDIKVPMLVCASWSTQGLHNRGTFEGFKQASSEDKWLYVHGRKEWETYYARESLELQKKFFDYFLKGIENDWRDTPRVSLEVREEFYKGQRHFENEWPIARTNYTQLYLDGKAMALQNEPSKDEIKLSYKADPGQTENNELRFKTTFKEDTELTGYMKLKLWVSAEDTDDMDLFVGIKKYDRRGNEVYLPDYNHIENGQVATGWLRVSHRELDTEKSTPYQPWLKHEKLLKLKKGEIVPVEIEILPSSTLFKAGESLVLVVKSSEIIAEGSAQMKTRYEHTETVNKGNHLVYAGGKYDSFLLVPVIPRKDY